MSCWVKFDYAAIKAYFDTVSSSYDTPTGNIIGAHTYAGLCLAWKGNSLTNFTRIDTFAHIRGTGANVGTGSFVVPDGVWTHLALTADYTTKTLKFYANGTYISQASYSGLTDIATPSGKIFGINKNWVYGGNGPGLSIAMKVNDVRVYNHALSELEVRELSKGLVLHYNFNQLYTTNICNWRDTSIISMGGHGGTKTYADDVLTLTAKDGW
jgi:hypothetical protein